MWPRKKGLGVQLGYGIQGPSLHLEQLKSDTPWEFARAGHSGLDLKKVKYSDFKVIPPQVLSEHHIVKDGELESLALLADVKQHISEDTVDNITKNDERMDSPFIYDASKDTKVIDFGPLRRYHSKLDNDLFAYASGPMQSKLVVQIKIKRTEIVCGPENQIESDNESENESTDSEDSESDIEPQLEKPDNYKVKKINSGNLGVGSSIELNSKIEQIEISRSCSSFSIPKDLIFVRTGSEVYVIKVHMKANLSFMQLIILSKFDIKDYFNYGLAFLNYCPYDNSSFSAIDIKGNWSIFKLSSSRQDFELKYRGEINNAEDLSNFKRIYWTNKEFIILLVTRDRVKKVDLLLQKTTDLVTANVFSKFRDYKNCDSNDNFGFLLTSRELIWIDLTDNRFERILSWKHYLNEDDPSLIISQIITVNGTIIISLQSRLVPSVFLYQFKFENGLPSLIHDPILISTESSNNLGNILVPINKDFISLFTLTNKLELIKILLSTKDVISVKYAVSGSANNNNSNSNGFKTSVLEDIRLTHLGRLKENPFKFVYENLFYVPKFQNEVDLSKIESLNGLIDFDELDRKPIILTDLIKKENFGYLDDFKKLDEIIKDFIDKFKLNGYEQISITNSLSFLLGKTFKSNIGNFESFYDNLLKLWRSSVVAKYATRDLSLSLVNLYDSEYETAKLEQKLNKLPLKLKNLISNWDNDNLYEDENEVQQAIVNRRIEEATVEELAPIIQVSQAKEPTSLLSSQKLQSDKKKRHLSSQTMSQSTQQRKKKRKLKGFA